MPQLSRAAVPCLSSDATNTHTCHEHVWQAQPYSTRSNPSSCIHTGDPHPLCCAVQIYTQMSKLLGKVFFPSNDPVLQVSRIYTRPRHWSAWGDCAAGGLVVTDWYTHLPAA